MVEKEQENPEEQIEEIASRELSIPPVYSNFVRVVPSRDFVLIDFGFLAPSYKKPYDFQDTQIARICLDWETSKDLLKDLREVNTDRIKLEKAKQSNKKK
jgi:hypothetical protein